MFANAYRLHTLTRTKQMSLEWIEFRSFEHDNKTNACNSTELQT